MKVDPVASMRCWGVTLELGGRVFEIPALPAADWWPVLVSADTDLVLGLIKDSSGLDEMILSGEVVRADLDEVLQDVISEVTGRSVTAATALAVAAEMSWPVVGGTLAQAGFQWDRAPIGAALDAIYAVLVPALPEKERKQFLSILDGPPRGTLSPEDRQEAEAHFESIAGPKPTTGIATAGPSGNERPRTRPRPRPLRRVAR